jgi:hypothetical protein
VRFVNPIVASCLITALLWAIALQILAWVFGVAL